MTRDNTVIGYHIHIAHLITRNFAHHELTQDSINSRIFYCIAISKSLQPCPHFVDGMNYRWLMSDV